MRERAEELAEREHRLQRAADAHAAAARLSSHDHVLDEAAAACGLRASWERPGVPMPAWQAPRPPPTVGSDASLDAMEA